MIEVKQYRLKNGKLRWKLRLYLGRDELTGTGIDIKRQGFLTRSEALKKGTELEKYYQENQVVKAAHSYKPKFQEIANIWFEQYKYTVKENTYYSAVQVYEKQILPKFKNTFIDKISVLECQKIINEWYSTYAKSAYLVSITSRIVKLAINLGYCESNPFEKTVRPRNTKKEEYDAPFYDRNQLLYFLDCIKDEELINRTMFHVLAFTGLRKGELYGLRWTDINEVNRTLTVNRVLARGNKRYVFQDPKTKKSRRTITLDDTTYNILMQWKLEQRKQLLQFGINSNTPNQLMFTRDANQHFSTQYINRVLKRNIEKHNLPHITIHGFRHTHCSLLFEAGVDTKSVQVRLGHSSIQTTMNIYAHVTKNKRDESADKFASFMSL